MINTITDESMAVQYLKAKLLAERGILMLKLVQLDLDEIGRITNGTAVIDIPKMDTEGSAEASPDKIASSKTARRIYLGEEFKL